MMFLGDELTTENINNQMFRTSNNLLCRPVDVAIMQGAFYELKKMVSKFSPDLNLSNPFLNAPLHLACDPRVCPEQNYEIIKFILQQPGININQTNAMRSTPLQMAISLPDIPKYLDIISLFLQAEDIDLNHANCLGNNLAHTAAKSLQPDALILLWRSGVNLLHKNNKSETPLDSVKDVRFMQFKINQYEEELNNTIECLEYYQNKNPLPPAKNPYSCEMSGDVESDFFIDN
ncbi:MAG: hypothetical protein DGJ47_000771 [Rickettsiaceae bacterium]